MVSSGLEVLLLIGRGALDKIRPGQKMLTGHDGHMGKFPRLRRTASETCTQSKFSNLYNSEMAEATGLHTLKGLLTNTTLGDLINKETASEPGCYNFD